MTKIANTAETALQQEFQPESQDQAQRINLSEIERQLSLVGGIGFVLLGLSRRSLGGLGIAGIGAALLQRGYTGHCALYSALGVNSADHETSAEPEEYFDRGIHVEQSVTILRSAEDLFNFWHDFENLPRFMRHVKSVQQLEGNRSRWIAEGPAGSTVQWDAEIINEEPNATIAWRSIGGSDVDNAGSVRFVPAPGDRGTEVRVTLDYIPPAGTVGRLFAKLFGKDPQSTIREDLRNFKRLMEAGEIPTTTGQPRGNCKGTGRRQTA